MMDRKGDSCYIVNSDERLKSAEKLKPLDAVKRRWTYAEFSRQERSTKKEIKSSVKSGKFGT